MNEWGIPDWRDASNYGDVTRWSMNRWRWEFYRRRDDLRQFFDRWAEICHKEDLRCNGGRTPNAPGFLAFGRDKDAGVGIEKFGYAGVPNPRISDQPARSIVPYDQLLGRLRNYYNPRRRKPSAIGVLEAVGKRTSNVYEIWLEPNEYAIRFYLDSPLKSQLDNASSILKDAQKRLHGKVIKRAQHQEKWLGYLRTLDARAENIPWSETASIDTKTAQTPQTARDRWKQANALRFNF